MQYDETTHYAEARGNVKVDHFQQGEHVEADRVEYNLEEETGKYYNVHGYSPAKIESRPGVLTTNNPFSFEGKWAERVKNRYLLNDGMLTDSRLPKPCLWMHSATLELIPAIRSLGLNSVCL